MKFLVIYAHPVATSFVAAVHRCVVDTLVANGHDVDDCDLYAERFDPVLSRDERLAYHSPGVNQCGVQNEVRRLKAAEAVVFVFPTWYYGMPAILKGYFDRVWVPGVAFEIVEGRVRPTLGHIHAIGVVTTYGSPWWLNTFVFRDPNRKAFLHGFRRLLPKHARTLWLAQYDMDRISACGRERFLENVRRRFGEL